MGKINICLDWLEKNPLLFVLMLLMFHVGISSLMYLTALWGFLPSLHNGAGQWLFAMDSFYYHDSAIHLVRELRAGNFLVWWNGDAGHVHVKWIALSYWILGDSSLSFELINAPIWLLTVASIWATSRLLFLESPRLAYVPAMFFGLLPSYLLHTTQLLKDPIYILGISLLMLGWVLLIQGRRRWGGTLLLAVGFFFVVSLRMYLLPLVLVVIACGLLYLLAVKQKGRYQVLVSLLAIVAVSYLLQTAAPNLPNAPSVANVLSAGGSTTPSAASDLSAGASTTPSAGASTTPSAASNLSAGDSTTTSVALFGSISALMDKMVGALAGVRDGFARENINVGAKSQVDVDVAFHSYSDLVNYVPRALQVGFLSPFPNQWIEQGNAVGSVGRLIAGVETFFWYLLIVGSLLCLRYRSGMWVSLSMSIVLSILTVLLFTLVVTNVGTIYRMRMGYLMPFYILGVYGLYYTWSRYGPEKN